MPKLSIKAIISVFPSVLKKQRETEIYYNYVADALKCLTENTQHMAGGGSAMSARYADAIKPRKIDTRTDEEIIADVIKRAGIKVVNK